MKFELLLLTGFQYVGRMNMTIIIAFLLLLLFAPATPVGHAQSTSPCNQGRAEWPAVDPRHPALICLPERGRMGDILSGKCKPEIYEWFGQNVKALGDVDHDGRADWSVTHNRCDTFTYGRTPNEVLLYRGVRDGLPTARSRERIGPTEVGSLTTLLATGDWDGDGNIDLAARIQIFGDTSFGNRGYDIATCVVFWGNVAGRFTINDTTRLWGGADGWAGPNQALTIDVDHDGVHDLITWNWEGAGLTNGKIIPVPKLVAFHGSRERWGSTGTSRRYSFAWWEPPSLGRLAALDQDFDGATDIVSSIDVNAGTGFMTILYGSTGNYLLDTSQVETIDLAIANGHSSVFADLTGDTIPELIVHAGSEEYAKIFVGLRGQRLREQYGTGNDPGQPDSARWWGRPWAKIDLPRRVNRNWDGSTWTFFGGVDGAIDANLDGVGDLVAYSHPYVMFYNGGEYLDSLADAIVDMRPYGYCRSVTRLGDVDGSGRVTYALAGQSGVAYAYGSADVPQIGRMRRLPEGTGVAATPLERPAPARMWLSGVGRVKDEQAPARRGE